MAMPYNYDGTNPPISFSQLQTEFGGFNPILLSEYYRGGPPLSSNNPRVPSYYNSQYAAYVARSYSTSNRVAQSDGGIYGALQIWTFSSVDVMSGAGTYTYLTAAQNSTTAKYKRGDLISSTYVPADEKTGEPGHTDYFYDIMRYQYVPSTPSVNTTVPASGTISMSQFYNTRDYTEGYP